MRRVHLLVLLPALLLCSVPAALHAARDHVPGHAAGGQGQAAARALPPDEQPLLLDIARRRGRLDDQVE
jgi:hypothetical protein